MTRSGHARNPPIARATAACSVRCECMIGRVIGLLRGSSSSWCVRCSPGCVNLQNGGQADSKCAPSPNRRVTFANTCAQLLASSPTMAQPMHAAHRRTHGRGASASSRWVPASRSTDGSRRRRAQTATLKQWNDDRVSAWRYTRGHSYTNSLPRSGCTLSRGPQCNAGLEEWRRV